MTMITSRRAFAQRAAMLGLGIAGEATAAAPPAIHAAAPEPPEGEAAAAEPRTEPTDDEMEEARAFLSHSALIYGGLAALKEKVAGLTEDDIR